MPETMVFKTLDIRQQRIAFPQIREKNELSPVVSPAEGPVLLYLGWYKKKIPQTGWFKQQKLLLVLEAVK